MRSEVHSECGGETFFGERAETGTAEREGSGGAQAAQEIVEVVEKRLPLAQLLALEGLLRHADYREQSLYTHKRKERGHSIRIQDPNFGGIGDSFSLSSTSAQVTLARRDYKSYLVLSRHFDGGDGVGEGVSAGFRHLFGCRSCSRCLCY